MDAYLWMKALHVIAVVIFTSGVLVAAVSMPMMAIGSVFLERVRRWDRRVTTPAMLMVWVLGVALAMTGDWFSQPWLMVKLGFVVILSALHGVLSGALRLRLRGQDTAAKEYLRHAAAAVAVLVAIIVVLVVVKPF